MKKFELTKTEQKVLTLIGYEPRISKYSGYDNRTKTWTKLNPDYYKKCQERIKKVIRETEGVENLQQLFAKLNTDKKEADKAAWKIEKKRRREASDLDEVTRIICRNAANNVISMPTKKQAAELITFENFGKTTGRARALFIQNYFSESLETIWALSTGAHENYFRVWENPKIFVDVDVTEDWDVYSKKTKYAAHHYTFNLHMPKNYSFAKIRGLLTIFKGKKIERSGMPVVWLQQSRGMEVKEIEGFLIRGFHIKKSKTVQTLDDAILKVKKQRSKTARQIRERRFWKNLSREQISERLKTIWITAKDSVAAGNCPEGTAAFKNRYQNKNHFGNVGAVRADELIEQANGEIYFVKKILTHKLGISI